MDTTARVPLTDHGRDVARDLLERVRQMPGNRYTAPQDAAAFIAYVERHGLGAGTAALPREES